MAVRPIDANWLKNNLNKVFHRECDELYGMMQLIDEAPTLTPPNEWVSVEERLPEESYGMVLLTNGKVVIYGYRNKLFRFDRKHGVFAPAIKRGGGYMQVTYWMPLPAPPDRCPPEEEKL